MRRWALRVLRGAVVCAVIGHTVGAPEPPSTEVILEIERRGREIALYLDTIESGREVLEQNRGRLADPDHQLLLPGQDGWRIVFLKETDVRHGKREVLVLADAPVSFETAEVGVLRLLAPPRRAAAATVSYARALEAARASVVNGEEASGFDEAVFRERDGTFSVYLMPRPDDDGIIEFGADHLVRIASSGRKMISTGPLHSDVEALVALDHSGSSEPTLHLHDTGDLPTPTDVATVLRNTSLAPHLVLTPHFMYRIDARGAISYLGANPVVPGKNRTPAEETGAEP